jgi:hypothetical protein
MTKGEILKLIRRNCLDCMGGMSAEVEKCTSKLCVMLPLRFGKDPNPSPGMVAAGKRQADNYKFGRKIDDNQKKVSE